MTCISLSLYSIIYTYLNFIVASADTTRSRLSSVHRRLCPCCVSSWQGSPVQYRKFSPPHDIARPARTWYHNWSRNSATSGWRWRRGRSANSKNFREITRTTELAGSSSWCARKRSGLRSWLWRTVISYTWEAQGMDLARNDTGNSCTLMLITYCVLLSLKYN